MYLEVGKKYEVKVTKILPIGAVVEFVDEPGTTELIHISNIADCFVKDVGDFVNLGQVYSALCEEGKVKKYQLSFKHLGLESCVIVDARKPERRSYGRSFDRMISEANDVFNDKDRAAFKRSRRR